MLKQLGFAALYACLPISAISISEQRDHQYFEPACGIGVGRTADWREQYAWGCSSGHSWSMWYRMAHLVAFIIAVGNGAGSAGRCLVAHRNGRFDLHLRSLALIYAYPGRECRSIICALAETTALLLPDRKHPNLCVAWLTGDGRGAWVVMVTPLILCVGQKRWRRGKMDIRSDLAVWSDVLLGQVIFLGWFRQYCHLARGPDVPAGHLGALRLEPWNSDRRADDAIMRCGGIMNRLLRQRHRQKPNWSTTGFTCSCCP